MEKIRISETQNVKKNPKRKVMTIQAHNSSKMQDHFLVQPMQRIPCMLTWIRGEGRIYTLRQKVSFQDKHLWSQQAAWTNKPLLKRKVCQLEHSQVHRMTLVIRCCHMWLVDLPYLIPEIHGMPPSHTCGGPSTNTIYRVSHSLTKWKK